jgi:hypothetical protein
VPELGELIALDLDRLRRFLSSPLGRELFTPEVRARYDLVGFDPRGISTSAALRCFGNDRQWAPFFTPFAFPMNAEPGPPGPPGLTSSEPIRWSGSVAGSRVSPSESLDPFGRS